jgi:hypothetical protein
MDDQDRTLFTFVSDCEVCPVSRGDFERATDHITTIRVVSPTGEAEGGVSYLPS